jgi:DNA primase
MDFVEQLKSSIDIVKIVGDYVRLKRVGATGRYLGLCPFHQEKTPSFNVNQSRQFYKCFGCGAGGDALKFVMEVEGFTFPEALKMLAERNGIPMPKRSEYSDAESRLRGALMDMHAIATQMYQNALRGPLGADARAYIAKRGLSQELVDLFQLGFSDPHGQALTKRLTEEKFTPEQMEASGLVRRRQEGNGYYDAFRGRLMFPIHNETGKVIGFGGRAMGTDASGKDEQPKYLNSPETPIYRKTSTLYNLHRARDGMRKANRAVLVEGYMDVIGVYAAGVREVVASCGTALTNAQIRAIHRHCDTVIVNFDPDTAGANAAERAIQLLLDENLHVKVVSLEGGLDPDEYVKSYGADAYLRKLEDASGYFHWLADRARARFDMRSADGRMDAFKFLMPSVEKIPTELERAAVANDLASYLGVDAGLVLDQFKRAATSRRSATRGAGNGTGFQNRNLQSGSAPVAKARPVVPAMEKVLVNTLVSSALVREEILPRLPEEVTASFVTHEIFDALRHMNVAVGEEAGDPAHHGFFSELDARLGDSAKALLHDIVTADEIGDDAVCLQQAEACLDRLHLDTQKREAGEIRARVKAAEREGRFEEALHWMSELARIEEEVKLAEQQRYS